MSKKLLRPEDVQGDTAYDNILRAWLGHKVEGLPEEFSKMLSRWQDVDRLYKQGELVSNVGADGAITPGVKRFNWRGIVEWLREKHGISNRQAYDDIQNAKRFFLFADGRLDVEYARGASIEHGEMMMWKAFDTGDFLSASQFYKEVNKIKGLHEQTVDLPDYTEFQPPKITVVADPSELGFEKIENVDDIVAKILHEKKQTYLDDNAEDAEVIE